MYVCVKAKLTFLSSFFSPIPNQNQHCTMFANVCSPVAEFMHGCLLSNLYPFLICAGSIRLAQQGVIYLQRVILSIHTTFLAQEPTVCGCGCLRSVLIFTPNFRCQMNERHRSPSFVWSDGEHIRIQGKQKIRFVFFISTNCVNSIRYVFHCKE